MASVAQIESQKDRFKTEREEVERILASVSFRKAPKLSRILAYICEKYFDGTAENLKEYSIAVEALDRAPGFDPHLDAIVRVDLHLLRKRIESYYNGEGKNHSIRIVLPVGQYTPQFVYSESVENSVPASDMDSDPLLKFPTAAGLSEESSLDEVTPPDPKIGFETSAGIGPRRAARIRLSFPAALIGL